MKVYTEDLKISKKLILTLLAYSLQIISCYLILNFLWHFFIYVNMHILWMDNFKCICYYSYRWIFNKKRNNMTSANNCGSVEKIYNFKIKDNFTRPTFSLEARLDGSVRELPGSFKPRSSWAVERPRLFCRPGKGEGENMPSKMLLSR